MTKARSITLSTGDYDGSTPIPGKKGIRQEYFVNSVLAGKDLATAACEAGYCPNGNKATLTDRGKELMRNPTVLLRLAYRRGKLAQKYDVSKGRVIRALAEIAFSDPARFLDADTGNLLALHEMQPRARRAISSVEITTLYDGNGKDREAIGNVTKVRCWPKVDALEKLCKHLGLFAKDNAQKPQPVQFTILQFNMRSEHSDIRHIDSTDLPE